MQSHLACDMLGIFAFDMAYDCLCKRIKYMDAYESLFSTMNANVCLIPKCCDKGEFINKSMQI